MTSRRAYSTLASAHRLGAARRLAALARRTACGGGDAGGGGGGPGGARAARASNRPACPSEAANDPEIDPKKKARKKVAPARGIPLALGQKNDP